MIGMIERALHQLRAHRHDCRCGVCAAAGSVRRRCDPATGGGVYDVSVIDRYHKRGDIIGELAYQQFRSSVAVRKGAVTAFTQGTEL